jgi:hypothetical protein
MSVLSALSRLLIGPLELFFEVVFSLADHVLANPGLSIVALSLAMNFLVLPLYRRADALQAEERETEQRLARWRDHIKKTFSGNERFMMLQTYYRQNGYRQTDALKGSLSLLLEIPFFIAAYRFLSGLSLLQGISFGPIRDLGAPDGLLSLAGHSVNLLPILMTAINLVSAAIYLKGFPLKSKLQMLGMALIFLVLLYDSPAGLVFYWTLNNVFSLLKNIFYKLRRPGLVLAVLAALLGAAGLVWVLAVHPMSSPRRQLIAVAALALLELPLLLRRRWGKGRLHLPSPREDKRLFLFSSLFLTLLTGLLIPSALMASSPDEFVFLGHWFSPYWYLLSSLLLAAGTFLVWLRIFYELAGPKGRGLMGPLLFACAAMAAVDYLFFGTDRGNLSAVLVYSVIPPFPLSEALLNLLVLAAALPLLLWLRRKKPALARTLVLAASIAVLGMSALNAARIPAGLEAVGMDYDMKASTQREDWPRITLSRSGRNVVVLMLDRAEGAYLPYLFTERPELREQFAGFTFYPNTLSHGSATREGSPALYGGYEYTPEALDQRPEQSLLDKHNEALRVMPVLFSRDGYAVTVLNPSFAGYRWYPDLRIFEDYPEIRAENTYGRIDGSALEEEQARYYCESYFGWQERSETALMRNFFCHSMFRIAPVFLQPTLYNQGFYNAAEGLPEADGSGSHSQMVSSLSTARGLDPEFVNSYDVLPLLGEMTWIEEELPGSFVMMSNDVPHSPCLLQTPDYVPAVNVDNRDYDAQHAQRPGFAGDPPLVLETVGQAAHYDVNMATLIQLGRWMDWLREQGVYDNTRIIIVADHGAPLALSQDQLFGDKWWEDICLYNPLLLVKDFDSREFTVDRRFMTNGDVPLLATAGLMDAPRNPFTGNLLSDEAKYAPVHRVLHSPNWDAVTGEELLLPEGYWYVFTGEELFDPAAWSLERSP